MQHQKSECFCQKMNTQQLNVIEIWCKHKQALKLFQIQGIKSSEYKYLPSLDITLNFMLCQCQTKLSLFMQFFIKFPSAFLCWKIYTARKLHMYICGCLCKYFLSIISQFQKKKFNFKNRLIPLQTNVISINRVLQSNYKSSDI